MTDDLTARLERALGVQEQHEADLHPDAAALADLHARVARGRRGRASSYAAVAAVAAGVVGVAGWFGLQDRTVPEPAETPGPTAPASPTPVPTPTPSAQAAAPVLEPVALPGLPPVYRAPEGILEQAGPGWYLLAYSSGLYEPPPGDGERHALVLSAPTGELYHLVDVAPGGATPVRWAAPGVARAVVWDGQGESRVGSVDLLSGDVVVDDRLPAGVTWVGMSGADELWLADPSGEATDGTLHVVPPQGPGRRLDVGSWGAQVSPTGRTVVVGGSGQAVEAVDVATGRRTALALPPGQACEVVGWLDAAGVMASCVDTRPVEQTSRWNWDEHGGQVVRLDAAGGAPQTLAPLRADGVVPWSGSHVRDGVLVVTSAPLLSGTSTDCYEFCYGGAYLWSGGAARPVTTAVDLGDEVCEVRAGREGLLLRTGDLCYEETTGSQWWLVDEATGATRLVAPAVPSDLGIGAGALVERS